MKSKQLASAVGLIALGWHVLSIMVDAERCKANLNRWRADPSRENLIRLAFAEGVLIKDIGWLL